MSKEVLVFIDGSSSKPKVKFSTDWSLGELVQAVEGKFKDFLDTNQLCVTKLQLYDKDYGEYVNIEESEVKDILNKSKIKAVTDPRKSVGNDQELEAADSPQVQLSPAPISPALAEPPENGCETCFSFNDDQETSPVMPQDKNSEKAAAIFPHNRLWNTLSLRVYFLNPKDIPSSWIYSGHKYRALNAEPGHVISTMDILMLANKWKTRHPSVPKEQYDCVPCFIGADSPEDSNIRVWFRTNKGCVTDVGTTAENVPKGDKEANATMYLNLNGDDRYMEHLVMHEFGHALGLGHEHQQKAFGSVINKFFNENVVKKRFKMSDKQYSRDVAGYPDDHKIHSEYDPDSIMHYWFDPSWLICEYNTENKVHRHTGITEEEREILKALYRRKNMGLAEEISETDYKFVAKAYYDHMTKQEDIDHEANNAPTPAGGPLNSKPQSSSPPPSTMHILLNGSNSKYFNVLYEASYKVARNKWSEIGNALGLDKSDLTSIETKYRGDPGSCYNAMLVKWFESSENCYFDVFTDALKAKNVDLSPAIPDLEKIICEYANKQDSSSGQKGAKRSMRY